MNSAIRTDLGRIEGLYLNVIPGWKITWQHAPLTAGSQAIEDRIEDLTNVHSSLLSRTWFLCNQWGQDIKFLIAEVACIALVSVLVQIGSIAACYHRDTSC